MAKEESIPGVTLYVHGHSQNPCAGTDILATGYVTLTAEIRDFSTWDQVVAKLNGMPVYAAATLAETLVEVASRRATRAEEEAAQRVELSRVRIEELEAELSFRTEELRVAKQQSAALLEELETLRDFERMMNAAHK